MCAIGCASIIDYLAAVRWCPVRVRTPRGWHFSRSYAFALLGLAGTGALHPVSVHGLRIRRGGVRLFQRSLRQETCR